MTRYRNEYFTSTTAMATKLGTSNTATTDFTFTSNVSGYSLYGFATGANTNTRNYATVAALATSNATTVYSILSKAETLSATFYYNSNTTSGGFTSANTKSSASRTTYIRCTSTTAAGTSAVGGTITVPTVVSGSVGKYNTSYSGIAVQVGTMSRVAAPVDGGIYYAVYSSPVTIYYPSSATVATNMTRYRNEYFTSTTAMSTVLSSSTTGTTNFTFSSSVSGYSLYGFASRQNYLGRDYSSISSLAGSSAAEAYAILYREAETSISYLNSDGLGYTTTGMSRNDVYLRIFFKYGGG